MQWGRSCLGELKEAPSLIARVGKDLLSSASSGTLKVRITLAAAPVIPTLKGFLTHCCDGEACLSWSEQGETMAMFVRVCVRAHSDHVDATNLGPPMVTHCSMWSLRAKGLSPSALGECMEKLIIGYLC